MKTYKPHELVAAILKAEDWLDPSEEFSEGEIIEMIDDALESESDQEQAVLQVTMAIEARAIECARNRAQQMISAAQNSLFPENDPAQGLRDSVTHAEIPNNSTK